MSGYLARAKKYKILQQVGTRAEGRQHELDEFRPRGKRLVGAALAIQYGTDG